MNEREKGEWQEQLNFVLNHGWETHRQAFGPILEPAFQDNPRVRIPLTAALNCISRKDVQKGLEILRSIQSQCACDADYAAFAFCVGLAFEMAGNTEKMMRWYLRAGEYGHRFYLPYIKVARVAYEQLSFDLAVRQYAKAIECLSDMREEEKEQSIITSAYVNLCSVLTMMHRYDEAEQAWVTATQYNVPIASLANAAFLYAAKEDREQTEYFLKILKKKLPSVYEQTKEKTDAILEKRAGHFYVIPFEKEKITGFWTWFSKNQVALTEKLLSEEAVALDAIAKQLQVVCPLFTVKPKVYARKSENGYLIVFDDLYARTLTAGLAELIASRPKNISPYFSFAVSHGAPAKS